MSFNCGWQAGGFFAVYIFVLSFIVRFIFGDHSLVQAGTECLIFSLFSASVYTFGYYNSKRGYSDGGLLLNVFGTGAVMFMLGTIVHGIVPASFTSSFFLISYTAIAMFMSWLGYEDQRSEAYERYLHEHNMA
jgi:hypothetical protein